MAIGATTALIAATLLGACSAPTPLTSLTMPEPHEVASCSDLELDSMVSPDLAFEAKVVRVDGDEVRLRVTHHYFGVPHESVSVMLHDPPVPPRAGAGAFATGSLYLIASRDGVVLTCGQSGPSTPDLTTLYTRKYTAAHSLVRLSSIDWTIQ